MVARTVVPIVARSSRSWAVLKGWPLFAFLFGS
jgi:hypothetical protein